MIKHIPFSIYANFDSNLHIIFAVISRTLFIIMNVNSQVNSTDSLGEGVSVLTM